MVFCKNCAKDVEAAVEDTSGFSCCTECGKVLDDFHISNETTFYKGADGSSTAAGTFVSESGSMGIFGRVGGLGMYGDQDSREKTAAKGRAEISNLVHSLNIRPRDQVTDSALRLYKLALHANFTRGRRTDQVAACCLYTVCRLEVKPYMLIDFSDALQVNVYTLGACLLPLLKVFRLHDHETIAKPVDPSLYIHRFADRLNFGKKMQAVSGTAIRLVKSMKRDWILTGRRPAGVCGAALYISAHIHGFERSKRDVISVVHVCSQTLTYRLLEFADTDSGSLTSEEFERKAVEWEAEQGRMLADAQAQPPPAPPPKAAQEEDHGLAKKGSKDAEEEEGDGDGEKGGGEGKKAGKSHAIVTPRQMCVHMTNEGKAHFAHGMCHDCFVRYVTTTGGHSNSNSGMPPSFNRKKRGRPKKVPETQQPETQQLARANTKLMPALEAELDDALRSEELRPLALTYPGGSVPPPSPAKTPSRAKRALRGGASSGSPKVPPGSSSPAAASSPTVDDSRALVLARPQPAGGSGAYGGASRGPRPHTAEDELDGDDAAMPLASLPPGAAAGQEGDGAVVVAAAAATDADPDAEEDVDPFNDIDDKELETYLNTNEEAELKGMIWHHINQDYLEKQAAKAAAIEAAKQVDEERRLAAALAGKTYEGNNGKRKYKKKPKVEMPEAESPAEAVIQAMSQKKASTKIDYDVLEDLFDDEAGEDDMAAEEVPGDEQHKPDYEMKQMVRDYIGQHRDELQATETAEEKRQRAALEADMRRPGRTAGLGALGSGAGPGGRDGRGAKPRAGFSRMRPRAG